MNQQANEINIQFDIVFLSTYRETLDAHQLEIIRKALDCYFETGKNLSFRIIPKIIGKKSTTEFVESLKAFVSQEFDNGDRVIKLNVLGALITEKGSTLAGLLVQLLDLVREQYELNYDITKIHSSLLIEQKGFSNNQLTMLYGLMQLYGIYNLPITLGDRYSPLDWTVTITDRVVEFIAYKDSGDCLIQSLNEFFTLQISENQQALTPESFFKAISSQNQRSFQYQHQNQFFISNARLEELQKINHPNFDCTRLITLCNELNDNAQRNNVNAVAMLTRAILDHIPPIFGCEAFNQVVANYGGKSFKKSCKRLDEQVRAAADKYLHVQIRDREVVADMHEVNCSLELESLLSEICRYLKTRANSSEK